MIRLFGQNEIQVDESLAGLLLDAVTGELRESATRRRPRPSCSRR